MALVATPGASDANSYVTEPEADAYFETRPHSSAWSSVEDAEAALINASRMLDWYMKWDGYKTSETQPMGWPRATVLNESGYLIDDTVIPKNLKEATFEMALFSLAEDRVADQDMDGYSKMKVGPLTLESDGTSNKSTKKKAIPKHVRSMLADLVITGRLIRA